jgi:hypothetical protein
MNDQPAPTELLEHVLRRRSWDGVAAIIAACVGLLALCVSGYTAYLQRQQVRAQVWPYLEPGMSSSKREITMFNKGVGPAIIRNVQVLVDGKPQGNWKAVFAALGLNYDHHIPYSTLNGIVISGNDHIEQLAFPTNEDFNLFAHQVSRIEMKVCYCSSLDECWLFDDGGPGPTHQPVAQCAAPSNNDFFDNKNAEPAVPNKQQESKP